MYIYVYLYTEIPFALAMPSRWLYCLRFLCNVIVSRFEKVQLASYLGKTNVQFHFLISLSLRNSRRVPSTITFASLSLFPVQILNMACFNARCSKASSICARFASPLRCIVYNTYYIIFRVVNREVVYFNEADRLHRPNINTIS